MITTTSFLDMPRLKKQIIAATADFLLLPLTFCFSIWLRYDEVDLPLLMHYKWLIIALPIITIPIFIKFGIYRAIIRFIDHKFAYVAIIGITISTVLLATLAAFTTHMIGISRGVFGIYWFTAVIYIVGSRFIFQTFLLRSDWTKTAIKVAIYGAGNAGMQLASAIKTSHQYNLVAFIDDKIELQGTLIAGIRVYSSVILPKLAKDKDIKEILLAIPSLTKKEQKKIFARLEPLKIRIKVTQPIDSLVNGKLRIQDVRDIEIEDLLGRDPVVPNQSLMSSCIAGKSVLVTGAGGSIGSELCRQIINQRPLRLILLEISEYALYSIEMELHAMADSLGVECHVVPLLGSVLNKDKCLRILKTFSVDTVYHAAAYKHVPLVEHNPVEGIRNNVFGTLAIANAAQSSGVKNFVLISTDKAVRPTNVMGSSKRFAELIAQSFAQRRTRTKFCIVRFGNVLGSSGSVVPLFRKQIMNGGPITVTHPEITRYFMTIPEAAQLVIQAGSLSKGGEVFVLDMGDPIKIVDLAKRMVHLSGLNIKNTDNHEDGIEIKFVGLRPGEKLYEELLISGEIESTEHPLILLARESEIQWSELNDILNNLDMACRNLNHEEIRSILLNNISGYTPQCEIEDVIWLHSQKNDNLTADTSENFQPKTLQHFQKLTIIK